MSRAAKRTGDERPRESTRDGRSRQGYMVAPDKGTRRLREPCEGRGAVFSERGDFDAKALRNGKKQLAERVPCTAAARPRGGEFEVLAHLEAARSARQDDGHIVVIVRVT